MMKHFRLLCSSSHSYLHAVLLGCLVACGACGEPETDGDPPQDSGEVTPIPEPECVYVESGWGETGSVSFEVVEVAAGLATPWGLSWLSDGRILLTERDGRISLVDAGVVTPVGEVDVSASGEGGLLGLALDPDFASNRAFYVYATVDKLVDGTENQIQKWTLSTADQAEFQEVIYGGIAARVYHNGGRLRIGPDGYLYAGTGDAGDPERSQDVADPAGKILRLGLDGSVPADNPFEGSATWMYGIRNTQGFDWLDDGQMIITDHGPSGLPVENGRRDHDEISVANPGENLGWPDIYACEEADDMVTPAITFAQAMPPGGAAIYRGEEITEWKGDLLIGVLGFGEATRHLHRLRLDERGEVEISEVYLSKEYGRLREVIMGPDGGLYVTTSNCDGRGNCGDGDRILRIGRN